MGLINYVTSRWVLLKNFSGGVLIFLMPPFSLGIYDIMLKVKLQNLTNVKGLLNRNYLSSGRFKHA